MPALIWKYVAANGSANSATSIGVWTTTQLNPTILSKELPRGMHSVTMPRQHRPGTHEGTSQPRGPQLQANDAMKMQMKTMTRMAMLWGSLSDACAEVP